jgi:site-specific recombinase XerD
VGVSDAQENIMKNEVVIPVQARAWLENSVLAPYIPQFSSDLQRRGYTVETMCGFLSCAGHFAAWITQQRVSLAEVDERCIARFITEHLPHCTCALPVRRSRDSIRVSLTHLLETLRACGVATTKTLRLTPLQEELNCFDRYLDEVKGLTQKTRRAHVGVIHRFLRQSGVSKSQCLTTAQPADVRNFVLGESKTNTPGTIRSLATTLRSYFHFCAFSGRPAQRLLDVIPRVARWRSAPLPETLSDQEVQKLLDSFDQKTPMGMRGYAMVRCMTDLGLRGSEVVQLQFSDIDWRNGVIRLVRNKSRRTDVLPLPEATGKAIAQYLRAGRPQTSNRAIFVRHHAPLDQPVTIRVVQKAVAQGYRRCGLPYTRSHILRHSLASRLLRAGSPLKEISDVLRHRSFDTSMIYTKVDINGLRTVAMPWPGRLL